MFRNSKNVHKFLKCFKFLKQIMNLRRFKSLKHVLGLKRFPLLGFVFVWLIVEGKNLLHWLLYCTGFIRFLHFTKNCSRIWNNVSYSKTFLLLTYSYKWKKLYSKNVPEVKRLPKKLILKIKGLSNVLNLKCLKSLKNSNL